MFTMNKNSVCKIICRACLTDDNQTLVSIFTLENINSELMSLSEMLMECASVHIRKDDVLPKYICKECTEKLINSYVFKKLCYESEQNLLSSLRNTVNDFKNGTPEIDIKYEPKDEFNDASEFDSLSDNCNQETKPNDIKLETYLNETNNQIYNGYNDKKIEVKQENNFKCTSCKRCFKKENILVKHMKTHERKCERCPQIFSNRYKLSKHVTDVHGETIKNKIDSKNLLLDCTMCDKAFGKQVDLAKHMSEHVESKWKCHVCDKFYLVEWALKNHLMSHNITCKVCFMEFKSDEDLEKHKPEHKDHLSFVCKECGKQFTKKQRLNMHIRIHTGEKKYVCSYCGKAFALSGNLDVHIRIHLGIKHYKCKLCGDAFIHKKTLQSHHIMKHGNGERPYVCQNCGNTFTRQESLALHMKKHTGERRYGCTRCDKKFYRSGDLKNHFVTHTGEKNHECEFCGKAFNRKSTLRVHRKIHTGERPHVCNVCGRAFIQLHVLNSHMNTHK